MNMNTNTDDTPLDDRRFDRLVDGELTEEERRELLASLDDESGGWRRCALAFLQSQCWRDSFAAMMRQGIPGTADVKATRASHSPWPGRLGTILAMAASFLVALWVGSLLQQARVGHFAAPSGPMGEVARTVSGREQPDRSLAGGAPNAPSASSPWRMVTVSSPAGSPRPGASVSLPAVERDNVDEHWLRSLPPAMSDNVVQAFNRTGHQVEQHRELVPVPLQDGRQVVVPVDQVDVHYVGNNTTY
jgi:hypothetical protein